MRRANWTITFVLCMLAASGQGGAAQDGSTHPTRSTLTGVYTAQQAARGRDVYALACAACHTPATHTSPAFVLAWDGRPLSDLFGYLRESMPKNEPGSLSAQEYVQVMAYLLRMNGFPAGADELPADSTALVRIRIRMAAPRPGGGQARDDSLPRG